MLQLTKPEERYCVNSVAELNAAAHAAQLATLHAF